MEGTVIGIETIITLCVFRPNCSGVYRMKSIGVELVEFLHLGDLMKSVIKIPDLAEPSASPSLFHHPPDVRRIDDIFLNIPHEFHKNDLVHAGEHLRIG